ncbi:MAG TPA: chorismate synthase [Actinomycetota bacterium]|jgi:chorismate synthase|nr:chorismate synthase [Actinomycetota bacterium]
MLRYLTAGESHGQALVAVLEGLPAGVPLSSKAIAAQLARRRLGYGRGKRMRFEEDRMEVLGGLRHGRTLGSPLAVMVANSEWPKWSEVMAPDPVGHPEALSSGRGAPLTRPRPGHADLAGLQKYGFGDARPVLERASARETAARVAVGTAARALLAEVGITVLSHVVRLGPVLSRSRAVPGAADLEEIDASPVRCLDGEAEGRMVAAIDAARAAGDTLGGVFEVVVHGLPPGLGSYVHWDRKLDARLAAALMSVQAVKGVELGEGFAGAAKPGSRAHDSIVPGEGGRPRRRTGRSGGVEGGMSTGETLRARAAMKPLSTLVKALDTVDMDTGGKAKANVQRSDVTALPAAAVVGEAVVALVLADALLEKTGGDSLDEVRRNLDGYLATLWTAPQR